MPALFRGEITEELPDRCVLQLQSGPHVEALGLRLHHLGLLAHLVDPQRPRHPDRFPLDKSPYVLPPDERDVIAKPRAKQGEKAVAVTAFLIGHGVEQLCRIGVVILQTVSELAVNTAVLLLECNRKREQFLLREIREVFHRLLRRP